MADGADAAASRARRHQGHSRHDHRDRARNAGPSSQRAIQGIFYVGEIVIIATGAAGARWPRHPRARRSSAVFGVSACATCDGFLFFSAARDVVVVGGGNTRGRGGDLSDQTTPQQVTLIHRRDALRAEKDPAGEAVPQPEDRCHLGQASSRKSLELRETAHGKPGCACANTRHRQVVRPPLATGVFVANRPYAGNRFRGGASSRSMLRGTP